MKEKSIRKKSNIRKLSCRLLSFVLALTLVLSGCGEEGEKEYVVEDYEIAGGNKTAGGSAEKEEGETSQDIPVNSEQGSIKERLGEKTSFQDAFSIGGISADINVNYNPIEIGGLTDKLPSYKVAEIAENDVDEEGIVNRIFGDTAGKMNGNLKVDAGDSEYIIRAFTEMLYEFSGEAPDVDMFMGGLIGEVTESQAWIEEEDYFIHTYEGLYNEIEYQLMIAYSRVKKYKVVSLFPKHVSDLVDDPNIEGVTLLFPGNGLYIESIPDSYEMDFRQVMSDRPNRSQLSEDKLIDKSYSFVENKIGLDLLDDSINPYYDMYDAIGMAVEIEGETGDITYDGLPAETEKTELLFMPKTIDENLTGAIRSGYLFQVEDRIGGMTLDAGLYKPNYNYDSYEPRLKNSGEMWVDDSGVVAFDMTIGFNVVEKVSEDVPILTFENAMKAFEEAAINNFDTSQVSVTDSNKKVYFKNAYLLYYPIPSPDKEGEYIFAPVWAVESVNGSVTQSTTLINAMDGSLVEIVY